MAGGNARKKFRCDDANAGVEKTRIRGTQLAAKVGDQATRRIKGHPQIASRRPQRQGAQGAAPRVRGEECRKIDLGENIAVMHKHGAGQQKILHVFQSARRFKQHFLVAEENRDARIAGRFRVFREKPDEFARKTVRVDHDPLDAGRGNPRQRELAERHTADRDQWFGDLVGQRLQTLTPPRAEHECCSRRRAHLAAPLPEVSSRRIVTISDSKKPCLR